MHTFFSRILLFIVLITVLSCAQNQNSNKKDDLENKFGIVIHGGAGTILKKNISEEKENQYKAKLEEAIYAGYEILNNGGSSIRPSSIPNLLHNEPVALFLTTHSIGNISNL